MSDFFFRFFNLITFSFEMLPEDGQIRCVYRSPNTCGFGYFCMCLPIHKHTSRLVAGGKLGRLSIHSRGISMRESILLLKTYCSSSASVTYRILAFVQVWVYLFVDGKMHLWTPSFIHKSSSTFVNTNIENSETAKSIHFNEITAIIRFSRGSKRVVNPHKSLTWERAPLTNSKTSSWPCWLLNRELESPEWIIAAYYLKHSLWFNLLWRSMNRALL